MYNEVVMVRKTAVQGLRLSVLVFLFLMWPVPTVSPETDLFHPLDAHIQGIHKDDLDGILKRKYIRVLTTFNKTNFFIADGGLYGFEYSLLRDYERYLNRSIGRRKLKVTMEFIVVRRDELIPALLDGKGDIAAAGLTVTPERLRTVAFTRPYLTGVRELVVSHKGVRGLKTLDDLAAKRVYVRPSSSYFESLEKLNRSFAKKGLRPVRPLRADETLETEDILEMVNSGAIKLTVADNHIAEIWASVLKNIHIHKNLALREQGKIAWAVRKTNPALKKSLNAFLRTRRQGSFLGNIYFNRYFEKNRWINNPLGERTVKREEHLKDLFKKYARRYGFDWTLVMAVAFQESKLSNHKRSPAGAVGIMQVRPGTARDRNIGIKNVTTVENNIHAGVKYLAYLRDHFFSEPNIHERDRVRFSLAAYNAGPTKIQKVRSRARSMGLDPDRWFRNVELAALRNIGQEPVRYVSNINKYYILFNLAEENRTERTNRIRRAR